MNSLFKSILAFKAAVDIFVAFFDLCVCEDKIINQSNLIHAQASIEGGTHICRLQLKVKVKKKYKYLYTATDMEINVGRINEPLTSLSVPLKLLIGSYACYALRQLRLGCVYQLPQTTYSQYPVVIQEDEYLYKSKSQLIATLKRRE